MPVFGSVPLAPGKATFTVDDLERESNRGASGRVSVPIGAIQIETPVLRKTGEVFDFTEMKRVSQWARERKIGLHLDGARLYLAAAYRGVPVREYAALFDTVYISMYKYFNAASGAILAGPQNLLENLFHPRRMFGNGLSHVWPFAGRYPRQHSRGARGSARHRLGRLPALSHPARERCAALGPRTPLFALRLC